MADAVPGIEVEGPDGQVFAFPSGTPQSVMATAMQKHYGSVKSAGASDAHPSPSPAQIPSFDAMGNPTGGTEASAPAASMPYGEQMSNVGGAALDTAVRIARGVPFADRGAAALRSFATGNSYSNELAALRGAADRDKADHPWAATGGSLVGGAMLPLLGNCRVQISPAARREDLFRGRHAR